MIHMDNIKGVVGQDFREICENKAMTQKLPGIWYYLIIIIMYMYIILVININRVILSHCILMKVN